MTIQQRYSAASICEKNNCLKEESCIFTLCHFHKQQAISPALPDTQRYAKTQF